MSKPRLIVLNGFAAAGKTTIAKLYIADHSLALALEADTIVDCIGDWANHREEVRRLAYDLTRAMLRTYLRSGHDVILPYIVTSADEVIQFEAIARDSNAEFYEVVLYNKREDAIARLLKRGKWGEETSPLLTDQDMPAIENLMNRMEAALEQRPDTIKIGLKNNDPTTTYKKLLELIRV